MVANSHRRIGGLSAVVVAILVAVPVAAALGFSAETGRSPALSHAPVGSTDDLQSIPTPTPGYSNGELSYLGQSSADSNASPLLAGCTAALIGGSLTKPTGSGFGGKPPVTESFSFVTECGGHYTTLEWTFGDGNTSMQSRYNGSSSIGSYTWFYWNYTHVFHYIGSFISLANATDSAGGDASGSVNVYVSFVPSLFYTFYDEASLIKNGYTGGTYAIGLTEECDSGYTLIDYRNDVEAFDTAFSLPSLTLNFVGPGSTSCTEASTWPLEVDLDIEWAHVAAPGATIYVCLDNLGTVAGIESCDNLFYSDLSSYNTYIVSNSWGFCAQGSAWDSQSGSSACTSGVDPYGSEWSTYQTKGVNLVSSDGDYLPDGCENASYPASDPYGLAVGGTTVTAVGTGGAYGSERAWANRTISVAQCHFQSGTLGYGYFGETYGMNYYYDAPAWQSSLLGVKNRYFPDVSMVGNISTGVPVYTDGGWIIVGGTSVGAPIWAGILDVLFSASTPGLQAGSAGSFLGAYPSCLNAITNPSGSLRDGLGTPNVGCLSTS